MDATDVCFLIIPTLFPFPSFSGMPKFEFCIGVPVARVEVGITRVKWVHMVMYVKVGVIWC